MEKLRLDKYLWSIRLFKTRSQAAEACDKGRVKYNGDAAKASKTVSINDEYEVKTEAKRWRIKVTGLLHSRVQYAESIKYYIDIRSNGSKVIARCPFSRWRSPPSQDGGPRHLGFRGNVEFEHFVE